MVCAVTFHEDRLLFLRRSLSEKFLPGNWTLPAGKVEHGEKLETAVLRELYEETGIQGRLHGMIGESRFASSYKGSDHRWRQFNYLVTTDDATVRLLDGSNIDHLWVRMDDLEHPPVIVDDFIRRVIDQAVIAGREWLGTERRELVR
ncbi:NUDIX hydrolase [Streptosporangium sp. NBC_01495]|uniref:NUDIX hydrolase n=1 Tax=Streptosporangium sp. NBC_01495 TaxID=2903899 RepID=UPI002E34B8D1|nr:NUDIX hydrolase [Streptosporangium sp. NBC_01495]